MSKILSVPVDAFPPACSRIMAIGLASYSNRNLPEGSRLSPGYMKIPPYNKVRCTSATILKNKRLDECRAIGFNKRMSIPADITLRVNLFIVFWEFDFIDVVGNRVQPKFARKRKQSL